MLVTVGIQQSDTRLLWGGLVIRHTCVLVYLYTCVQRLRLIHTRPARHFFLRMIAIGAENALAHPRVAREICNRDSLQAQRPRGEQMEPAVP